MSDQSTSSKRPAGTADRIVRLSPDWAYNDYEGFQLNFMDQVRHRLIPSTEVYIGDSLAFQVNALGCKGDEPEPGLPLIGIFGDSFTQGVATQSFVDLVKVEGFAVVNGAMEGSKLANTVAWAKELHAAHPMACIAVHSGFHNLLYNNPRPMFWKAELDRLEGLPKLAHFRICADINDEAVERGYAKFLDGEHSYQSTPFIEQEFGGPRAFLDAIRRFNDFIEDYCDKTGRLLIDLDAVLAPKTYDDIAVRFFDVAHPRPEFYPAIAASIADQLRPYLELPTSNPATVSPPVPARAPTAGPENRNTGKVGLNYPLW